MYETLQLTGSFVAVGFITVIGIWAAWLVGASLFGKANENIQRQSQRQFDDRPFNEQPFNDDTDISNDGS